MNILFYMHQFPGFGGMEVVAATLAKEFDKRGHHISFLSHTKGCGTSVMTEIPAHIPIFRMPDMERLVSRGNQEFLKKIVDERLIDIIMFLDSYMPIEGNVIACGVNAKIITSEHSCPFFCHVEAHPENYTLLHRVSQIIRWRRLHSPYYYEGKRKRFLYDNSDLYVLLSNRFYGEFKCMARLFDSRKLRGINNPLAHSLKPTKIDFEGKENLIVFAATLCAEKGVIRALEAIRLLKKSGEFPVNWRVTILGDGPEREKCANFIEQNDLGFVQMHGYESNPQPFFARAKIFLLTSSREGFANVLPEAQANGCVPVAFASYASIYDIVHHGKDGLLVDAFDVEKYASAIRFLISDEAEWRKMALEASRVVERFAPDKIADQWEVLFQEVANRRVYDWSDVCHVNSNRMNYWIQT